jgi:integrase
MPRAAHKGGRRHAFAAGRSRFPCRLYRRARKPAAGTLFSLIAAFKTSGEFTGIRSEKTKKDYRRYLKMIEDEFGTMPVEAVEDKRARGKFKEWRDTMADRPRTADYAWTVLARVLSVAKDRGAIAINVCERGGRLYETDRTEIIWTADHIKKFCAVASDELQFSLLLALWTGQRQGDVIRLTWMQYDGSNIRLKQGKGKKRVVIPVGAPLKTALDSRRPAVDVRSAEIKMPKQGLFKISSDGPMPGNGASMTTHLVIRSGYCAASA